MPPGGWGLVVGELVSIQRTSVAPWWPCTASTASRPGQTAVAGFAPRHRKATDPSLNSQPSATTPVPETPLGSRYRTSSKTRGLTVQHPSDVDPLLQPSTSPKPDWLLGGCYRLSCEALLLAIF